MLSFIASLCTLVLICSGLKHSRNRDIHLLLLGIVILYVYRNTSNFLEWSDITPLLVPYEDYIDLVSPLLWLFIFYAFLQKLTQEELESKNAELERFVYTVSHDLKSPLVSVNGFLSLLQDDIKDNDQAQIQNDISNIKNAADQMNQLLDDMLELSRIGRTSTTPQPTSLNTVIQEVIDLMTANIKTSNATIDIEPDLPVVLVDKTRFFEIFQNLIDNALKYRSENRPLHIHIFSRSSSSGTIVYIKDNGIGVNPKYHDKIFGLFNQLNPGYNGTGIGLAIVKRIIEVHHGSIWIESEGFDCGSTFCISLPHDIICNK
ncbi:MAG: GHKL domain-containing protein [Sedimentisphaerales bacterium]|nr:GHKL domain-containing protein [Sedimentisphaerales bacterium]